MPGFATAAAPPLAPAAPAPASREVPFAPPVRAVWAAACTACALVLLLAAGLAFVTHRREMGDASRTVARLDTVLAEETARSLQNVGLVVDGIAADLAKEGIATPEAFTARMSGAEARAMLLSRRSGVPQLDAITVVSSEGKLLNFTRTIPLPDVNLADRDYFQRLRDTATDRPYLSEPLSNRGNGTWTTYLARRVSGPDGRFLGLVLGAIDLGYFQGFWSSLNLDKGMAVSLWRGDGTLMAREPALPGIGHAHRPGWMSQELSGHDGAVYESAPNIDEHPRIVASRRVSGFEAVVNVSTTRAAALSDWYLQVAWIAAAALACAAAIVAAAAILARQVRTAHALAGAIAARERADEERERTEAQLRQAQKMEAVGHLTGGIAHDFNNMLAIVVGSLDVLGRRIDRGEDNLRPLIDGALEGANRAASLTQRLLAFSRRQPLAPKVVDANAFVAEVAQLVERSIGKSLRFRTDLAPGHWRIEVDESQLENAILNLALNARDATPEGGEIILRTRYAKLAPGDGYPGGDHVVISLSDTGCGMDADTLARAVEPFFTTKDVGKGTGLGLSQVYGFASQSGGRLLIDSEPGRGTTVSLRLPRTHAAPERVRAPDAVPRARHPGETVLLVDDEESIRLTAAEMLRDLGYTVVHAGDPQAALRTAARLPSLSLLLTDVVMPDLDGRSLAAEIRSRRPGLPVLYATGKAPGDVEGPVLPKPFDVRRLAEAVRGAIDSPVSRPVPRLQAAVGP